MRKYINYQRLLMQQAIAKLAEIDTIENLPIHVREEYPTLVQGILDRMRREYADIMGKLVSHTLKVTGCEVKVEGDLEGHSVVSIAEKVYGEVEHA